MSAAEPARPAQTAVNTSPGGAVIDITKRVTRTSAKGRWKEVTSPRPGDGPDVWQANAEHFEATFNEHHLTLSDDDTATAYTVTIGIVRGILAGAQAHGVVDEEQFAELDALMEGMLSAPRLV